MNEATTRKTIADIIESFFTTIIDNPDPESDETIVEAPVIYANQTAPRPNFPYIVLKLSSFRKKGQDELGAVDDDGIQKIGGQRILLVTVDCFCVDSTAIEMASRIVSGFGKESTQWALERGDLALIRMEPIQDLTELAKHETGYESRSQFDIYFGLAENYEDEVGVIETVNIEENVVVDGDTITQSFTIEI